MDMALFRDALAAPEPLAALESGTAEARALGAVVMPYILLNGKPLTAVATLLKATGGSWARAAVAVRLLKRISTKPLIATKVSALGALSRAQPHEVPPGEPFSERSAGTNLA